MIGKIHCPSQATSPSLWGKLEIFNANRLVKKDAGSYIDNCD
jgi:hypothetical protein